MLAIKLGPKAGCWLKAPDFLSPSRFCPVPGIFFGRLERRKRAILPSKIAYVIEDKGFKKRKFLRFMKGTVQSRLVAKALDFCLPLLVLPGARYFPCAAGASAYAVAGSVEEAEGRIVVRFVRHGYL